MLLLAVLLVHQLCIFKCLCEEILNEKCLLLVILVIDIGNCFALLSASSHRILSTWGPLSSISLHVFCQSVRLFTLRCPLCLLSAVVSSGSAGS